MPKKTKKQKISAELRRKIFLINQIEKLQNHENQQEKAPSYDTDQQGITTKVNISTGNLNYFKHDFRKSLIIVSIIIALEIVIYFGTIIKYF